MDSIRWQDWGCVDYCTALSRQEQVLLEVQDGHVGDTVIFCSHPPVVTLGRATQSYEFENWRGEVLSINRGGRSTYHGPNQLVIYPIVDLRKKSQSGLRKEKDIGLFLRLFERALVETVADYGVEAAGRSSQKREENMAPEEATGVWVGERKLASLGIGVKKWCTFHGAAINLHKDEKAFKGVLPCGFEAQTMVSLEELTNHQVDKEIFTNKLQERLLQFLL